MKQSWFLLASLASSLAVAHPGHGMPEPTHWHASDVLGFVAVVAVVVGAWWWHKRK